MSGRERLEAAALALAALLLVALLGSSVFGILRPSTDVPGAGGAEPSRLRAVTLPPTVRGRIEVLNGAGRPGLARQATDVLRGEGFDVVYFGNASSRPDSSVVIARTGRIEIAQAAAGRLGISRVRSEPDRTLLLDATVILGKDWPRAQR